MIKDADWKKDQGKCVLHDMGECLANVREACICARMPKSVYMEYFKKYEAVINNDHKNDG